MRSQMLYSFSFLPRLAPPCFVIAFNAAAVALSCRMHPQEVTSPTRSERERVTNSRPHTSHLQIHIVSFFAFSARLNAVTSPKRCPVRSINFGIITSFLGRHFCRPLYYISCVPAFVNLDRIAGAIMRVGVASKIKLRIAHAVGVVGFEALQISALLILDEYAV